MGMKKRGKKKKNFGKVLNGCGLTETIERVVRGTNVLQGWSVRTNVGERVRAMDRKKITGPDEAPVEAKWNSKRGQFFKYIDESWSKDRFKKALVDGRTPEECCNAYIQQESRRTRMWKLQRNAILTSLLCENLGKSCRKVTTKYRAFNNRLKLNSQSRKISPLVGAKGG